MVEQGFSVEKNWMRIQVRFNGQVLVEPVDIFETIEKASILIAKSEQLLAQLHLDKVNAPDSVTELKNIFKTGDGARGVMA